MLNKMTEYTAIEMNDQTFSNKDPFDYCRLTGFQAIFSFLQRSGGHIHVALHELRTRSHRGCNQDTRNAPDRSREVKKVCLTLFSTIVSYLCKRIATGNNIATVDGDISNFRQGSLKATNNAKQV